MSLQSPMEFKSTIFFTFFLLFLLLPASPYSSSGESVVAVDLDVYEIDYRGPETHSSIPPPDHSRRNPSIHGQRDVDTPKFNGLRGCRGLRGCNLRGKGNEVNG